MFAKCRNAIDERRPTAGVRETVTVNTHKKHPKSSKPSQGDQLWRRQLLRRPFLARVDRRMHNSRSSRSKPQSHPSGSPRHSDTKHTNAIDAMCSPFGSRTEAKTRSLGFARHACNYLSYYNLIKLLAKRRRYTIYRIFGFRSGANLTGDRAADY